MKIHNFCFLCQAKQMLTPIDICELKGKEYVLCNNKYVLNKKKQIIYQLYTTIWCRC